MASIRDIRPRNPIPPPPPREVRGTPPTLEDQDYERYRRANTFTWVIVAAFVALAFINLGIALTTEADNHGGTECAEVIP